MLAFDILFAVVIYILGFLLGMHVGSGRQRDKLLRALREEQLRCVVDSSREMHP